MDHLWWIFLLKMVIFHSYVSLPEGKFGFHPALPTFEPRVRAFRMNPTDTSPRSGPVGNTCGIWAFHSWKMWSHRGGKHIAMIKWFMVYDIMVVYIYISIYINIPLLNDIEVVKNGSNFISGLRDLKIEDSEGFMKHHDAHPLFKGHYSEHSLW